METSKQNLETALNYIRRIIDDARPDEVLRPSKIATEACARLNGASLLASEDEGWQIMYCLAHEQCRHFADHELERPDPKPKDENEQLTLNYPLLLPRYPTAPRPDEEQGLIAREQMSDADVAYNVRRLRKKSRTLATHADQLERWHAERRALPSAAE